MQGRSPGCRDGAQGAGTESRVQGRSAEMERRDGVQRWNAETGCRDGVQRRGAEMECRDGVQRRSAETGRPGDESFSHALFCVVGLQSPGGN